MVNLLPPRAKKKIKREYTLRAVTVWALVLSISGVILILLSVPTHILIQESNRAFTKDIENLENETRDYQTLKGQFKSASQRLQYVSSNPYTQNLSGLMESIKNSAPGGVRVTNIATEFSGSDYEPVTVSGVADDRAGLATFRDELKKQETFSDVKLPIEDLAGDTDLTFTITLTVANN